MYLLYKYCLQSNNTGTCSSSIYWLSIFMFIHVGTCSNYHVYTY